MGYLHDIADNILTISLAALDESNTGNDTPNQTYVSWGPAAIDQCCDGGGLLVVEFPQVGAINHTQSTGFRENNTNCAIQPRINLNLCNPA